MFCGQCGFENDSDAKFCRKCGAPMEEESVSVQQAHSQNKDNKKSMIGIVICVVLIILIVIIGILFSKRDKENGKELNHTAQEEVIVENADTTEASETEVSDIDEHEANQSGNVNEQNTLLTEGTGTEEGSQELLNEEMYRAFLEQNFVNDIVVPYLFNLDQDEDCEIVVVNNVDNLGENTFEIYDLQNDEFQQVYSDYNYKCYNIASNGESTEIVYSTKYNWLGESEESEEYYKLVWDENSVQSEQISQTDYSDALSGSVDLFQTLFRPLVDKTKLDDANNFNYSSKHFQSLSAWARENNEKINDVRFVNIDGENILFATLGPQAPDYPLKDYDDSTKYVDSYAKVVYVTDSDMIEVLSEIELTNQIDDPYGDLYVNIEGYGIFHFDNTEQYYVSYGNMNIWGDYKFGAADGKIQLIDSDLDFEEDETGVYCYFTRSLDADLGWGFDEKIDITFEDGIYKQYKSEIIDASELTQLYENGQEELDACLNQVLSLNMVPLGIFEFMGVNVISAELQDVQKDTNGKYYLTYAFSSQDEDTGSIYDRHMYFTYHVDGNRLIREEYVNHVDKLPVSPLDFPAK